jgi:hypothetical protein
MGREEEQLLLILNLGTRRGWVVSITPHITLYNLAEYSQWKTNGQPPSIAWIYHVVLTTRLQNFWITDVKRCGERNTDPIHTCLNCTLGTVLWNTSHTEFIHIIILIGNTSYTQMKDVQKGKQAYLYHILQVYKYRYVITYFRTEPKEPDRKDENSQQNHVIPFVNKIWKYSSKIIYL